MTKVCSKCKEDQPLSEYGSQSGRKDGLRPDCRKCRSVYRKKEHKDNPEVAFEGVLRRRYGVSRDYYYSKLSAQDGKCAIPSCGRTAERRSLHVDHNHTTGNVRGLLCNNCNAALGHVDDNQEILQDLSHYLNMYDGSSHGGFVASIYASDQSN